MSNTKPGPTMFDDHVSFAGVELQVDPIDRERTDESENAMAIFYEEQPFMWQFVEGEVERSLVKSSGVIDFLDVGTGSGVLALLADEHTSADSVVGIDVNQRALQKAEKNKRLNDADINLRKEFYNTSTAPYQSCKIIAVNPPYHLYPPPIETDVPRHARGGIKGQQLLKEWLVIAYYHLAENGSLVFNHMCLGNEGGPAYTNYISDLVDGGSVHYTNIFPPMDTAEFLSGVYRDEFADYQNKLVEEFPQVFYTTGWIRRDGKEEVAEINHDIDLHGRTWEDRIHLHREIAKHGL